MTAPALPTFTDGTIPHQADFNSLVSNINILAANTAGKQQAGNYIRPVCSIHLTTTQNILTGTTSLVTWGAADINTDTMWVASTANQMTVQTAGTYFLTMSCIFANGLTSSGAASEARIMVNGTAPATNTVACSTTSIYNSGWFVSATAVAVLAANATIYFAVAQSSGSTGQLISGFGGCHASAVFLCS